jgi:hypothetical protein
MICKNNIYPQVRFLNAFKFIFLFTSLSVRGFQITFDPQFYFGFMMSDFGHTPKSDIINPK